MPPENSNEYLLLVVNNMQKQIEQAATKESVEALSRRLETALVDISKKLDEIANVRLEKIAKDQQTLAELNDRRAQESMRKVITVQTTILLTTLAAIIGVALNFIFRFIK